MMRRLISLIGILALVLGGVWLVGETMMARELRKLADADLGFGAAQIAELRDPGRIGVRLQDTQVYVPGMRLAVPEAQVAVSVLHPRRLTLTLPEQANLDLGQGPQPLGLSTPQAWVDVMALSGFAPGKAHLSSGPMTLEGRPLAAALTLDADLARLGDDAPPDTRAGYDLNLRLDGMDPAALPQLAMIAGALGTKGPLAMQGNGRLWLSTAPTPAVLAAGPLPAVTGFRIDQGSLQLGSVSARVIGRLEADDQGFAQGALAIYSADATPMLEAAASAGLISTSVVKLADVMIHKISEMPMPAQPEPGGNKIAPTEQDNVPQMVYPAAAQGELRLPLVFADGRISLGPIPLGPAPRLMP